MIITVSWDITMCSVGGLCQGIGGICSFQDSIFIELRKSHYKADKTNYNFTRNSSKNHLPLFNFITLLLI